jgi:periplasmic divalent cation tolerance protein
MLGASLWGNRMAIHLIYSPFPNLEAARAAAKALIVQKLAACCNLLPAGESHYVWDGEYTVTEEVVLIAKTTAERLEKAVALLTSLHPYECPAILSFEASSTSPFAAWAEACCH